MAATSGQTRWRHHNPNHKDSLSQRITRSARVLGRNAFSTDPGHAGEDFHNSVSPHWKRISLASTNRVERGHTRSRVLDDMKAERRALLVSDFRIVGRTQTKRSAQLEREFDRFANSFGQEIDGELIGVPDWIEKGENSIENRNQGRGVRFTEPEPSQSLTGGLPDEFQKDSHNMNIQLLSHFPHSAEQSSHWEMSSMPLIGSPGSLPATFSMSLGTHEMTQRWSEGDVNSLYGSVWRNNTSAMDRTSNNDRQAVNKTENFTEKTMHADSAVFIEDLAISDDKAKRQAIERLKDVERHLSHFNDSFVLSNRNFGSQHDEHILHDLVHRSPSLLSGSLNTALADHEVGQFFFYCPYLTCHRRLLHLNARIDPSQGQRSCVHTECSYVSHDLSGWITHCMSPHHNLTPHEHDDCGFHCYSAEDTH